MNRRNKIIIIAAVVLAALITPRLLISSKSEGGLGGAKKAGPGKAGARAVSVTAVVVKAEKTQDNLTVSGTVLADESVELRSETSGRVVRIAFREGGRVRQGDLLVKFNDDDLKAQLLKAQAALTVAESKEKRAKTLLEKEMMARQDYDNVQQEYAGARADVALYEAQIAKTEIRAPFDGKIGLKDVSPGAYLVPGARIATITGLGLLKVEFAVPERYAGRLKDGRIVSFTLQNEKDRREARVYAGDYSVDPATRTVRFRARLLSRDEFIPPGASVRVEIPVADNPSALMVPGESIVRDASGPNVFVLRGGAAVATPVALGARGTDRVEVLGGLSAGDTVAVMGVQSLKDGARVEIRRID